MNTPARFALIGAVLAAAALTIIAREDRRREAGGELPAETTLDESLQPRGNLPRLLDLGSDQCIPCKKMAPILEELGETYAGVFRVEVIDVRQERAAAVEYGIRVIPTQIFFDSSGRELFRHEGFMSREAILSKWRELGVDSAESASGA